MRNNDPTKESESVAIESKIEHDRGSYWSESTFLEWIDEVPGQKDLTLSKGILVHKKRLSPAIYGSIEKYTFHTDTGEDSVVCVKKIRKNWRRDGRKECAEDPLAEIRLMREFAVEEGVDKCDRHHITVSKHVFQSLTHYYSVFDFFPCDLFTYVKARPNEYLSEREAKRIFRQLIVGLSFLHERGIAHLDLSLENIVVGEDSNVRIIDFGQARKISHGQRLRGLLFGKEAYVFPKVIEGEWFDPFEADVWSAGVILFCILTGYPPFDIPTPNHQSYRMISLRENGGLDQLLVHWDRNYVSAAAREMLKSMLRFDAIGRRADYAQRSLALVKTNTWIRDIDSETRSIAYVETDQRCSAKRLRVESPSE